MINRSFLRTLDHELVPCAAISAAFLIFSLVSTAWILPQWRTVLTARTALQRLQAQVNTGDGLDQLSHRLKTTREQLRDRLAELSQGMADPRDLSGLLQMLISRADAADIRFVKMEPEAETRGEDYILYPVVLEMTTSPGSLAKFIAKLEEIPQLVRIDRLGVSAKQGGTIEAAIRVVCFLNPEGDTWKTGQPEL